jgi:ribosome biogenesis GTPase
MTIRAAHTGLVVAAHGRRGILEADGTRLRFVVKGRRLRIVCGDRVRFESPPGSDERLVTEVESRANALARPSERGEDEVIAANLTRLIAVCAPRPEPDWLLMDRYACAAELLGCSPVVLWNKCDLGHGSAPALAEYRQLGYAVLEVSSRTGAGLAELRTLMDHQTSVFVGQSGVGKSSLINTLVPGAGAVTGELSAAHRVGTHTTTAALMYAIGTAGKLIDTPGVRDFVPAVPARRVDAGFPELRALVPRCRFADCSHLHEPGCAVKAALEAGELSARRYASYTRLMWMLAESGL